MCKRKESVRMCKNKKGVKIAKREQENNIVVPIL